MYSSYSYVRTLLCMHTYAHTILLYCHVFLFFVWGVLQLTVVDDVMCTRLCLVSSMVTGRSPVIITASCGQTRQFVCVTPRQGGLRFGTAK